jgi:hypothetical protein
VMAHCASSMTTRRKPASVGGLVIIGGVHAKSPRFLCGA